MSKLCTFYNLMNFTLYKYCSVYKPLTILILFHYINCWLFRCKICENLRITQDRLPFRSAIAAVLIYTCANLHQNRPCTWRTCYVSRNMTSPTLSSEIICQSIETDRIQWEWGMGAKDVLGYFRKCLCRGLWMFYGAVTGGGGVKSVGFIGTGGLRY